MNLLKYTVSLICVLLMSIDAQAIKINYQLAFEPNGHYALVTLNISNYNAAEAELKMPVWTPGSYLIREYAKNIDRVIAEDAQGVALAVRKTAKDTWKIEKSKVSSLKVTYRVYCFELAVRNAFINREMAYLNGAAVFMYLKGFEKEKLELSLKPNASWKVLSTALPRAGDGYWELYANDLDELLDSPIQIGNHETFHFVAEGVKHEVAMVNAGKYDSTKMKGDFISLIKEEAKVFGHHPAQNYVFIVHHLTNGSGGLEHKNSTTLSSKPNAYENENTYNDFFRLVAHEYFHLWNVKRLRPEPLGPFNYQEENYTSLLWIAEGFTAYYDDLMVTRAGLGKREAYLSSVAGAINYATNSIGSKVQSVSESSFDAWIKYYRGNENSGNTTTDYYTKGSVIALYLDLLILKNSKGERSLDNVMKSMYETYYRKLNRPYSEAEFKEVLEKNVGGNLDDFFQKYIHGTEVLKLDELLLEAGFLLEEKNNLAKPYLGFNVRNSGNDRFVVYSVQEGYEAMEAGFNPNDVIVTVNGEKPNIEMFTTGTGMIIGTPIQFEILRDTRKISITATPRPNPFPTFAVTSLEKLTSVQKAIQKKWLGNK